MSRKCIESGTSQAGQETRDCTRPDESTSQEQKVVRRERELGTSTQHRLFRVQGYLGVQALASFRAQDLGHMVQDRLGFEVLWYAFRD